jgi:hypothetical protein
LHGQGRCSVRHSAAPVGQGCVYFCGLETGWHGRPEEPWEGPWWEDEVLDRRKCGGTLPITLSWRNWSVHIGTYRYGTVWYGMILVHKFCVRPGLDEPSLATGPEPSIEFNPNGDLAKVLCFRMR